MSPAALLQAFAGLLHVEAARFLGVRLDTVQSWHRRAGATQARTQARAGILALLRTPVARQESVARNTLDGIARLSPAPDGIELGYPADDHEAEILGFPCVGAWRAMAARIVAAAPIAIRLIPRGSTPATTAAADMFDRVGVLQ